MVVQQWLMIQPYGPIMPLEWAFQRYKQFLTVKNMTPQSAWAEYCQKHWALYSNSHWIPAARDRREIVDRREEQEGRTWDRRIMFRKDGVFILFLGSTSLHRSRTLVPAILLVEVRVDLLSQQGPLLGQGNKCCSKEASEGQNSPTGCSRWKVGTAASLHGELGRI